MYNVHSVAAVTRPDALLAVIYSITCLPTGRAYVGGTLRFDIRRKEHNRLLNRGKHSNRLLQAAFDKYGPSDFVVRILEACKPRDRHERETYWIKQLNAAETGFNIRNAPKRRPNDQERAWRSTSDLLLSTCWRDYTRRRRPRLRKPADLPSI